MNAKNKLIEKLLIAARKHKVLTYPVLALVSIISFFSYFFSWSQGAGKRIIAIIMVMVLMVSQSYFLTTSATTMRDDEKAVQVQKKLQKMGTDASTVSDNRETDADIDSRNEETDAENSEQENEASTEETNLQDEDISDEEGNRNISDDTALTTENSTDGDTTESGGNNGSTTETAQTPPSTGTSQKEVEFGFYYVDKDATAAQTISGGKGILRVSSDTNIYDLSSYEPQNMAEYTEDGCYGFSDKWYYDLNGHQEADLNAVTTNGEGKIVLYKIREIKNYKVTVIGRDFEDEGSTPGYFKVEGEETSECLASFDGLVSFDDGNMTITDISREGYHCIGAKVTNKITGVVLGNFRNNPNGSVSVSFTGNTLQQQVVLLWEAEKYQITYSKDKDGTDAQYTQTVTFDGDETFFGEEIDIKKEKGYKFKGWRIGQDGSEIDVTDTVRPKVSQYQNSLYKQEGVVLYPVYDYDGIIVEEKRVDYEFEKPSAKKIIKGKYHTSEASTDHFEYSIIGGKEALADKGIEVATDGGIVLTTTGPTGTTPSDAPIELIFSISDPLAPEDQEIEDNIFTVEVYIAKRKVKITEPGDGSNIKTYDGTTKANPSLQVLETDVPGITVTFERAEYNSKNVKDANEIILSGVNVSYAVGLDSANYELEDIEGKYILPGHILQRKVPVITSAEFSKGKYYVRTGEDNPEFKVTVDTGNSEPDTGFIKPDSIDKEEGITFSTDREDLMEEGKYYIEVSFSESSNYKAVQVEGTRGIFEVIQETPIVDKNYQITGTKGLNGWYVKDLAVSPITKAGYNTIRVSTDGGKTFETGSIINLKENASKEGRIWIQLYDSETHAVTSWKEIAERIDQTSPEYISYSISQSGETLFEGDAMMQGGLYFPTRGMLTFGTYFNKTVTVTVKYKDTASGLSTLSYGLYGAAAGTKTIAFGATDEEGYATATFEIYQADTEKSGNIKFYATDAAGNKGAVLELRRNNASDWSVESSGPVIEDFFVTAGETQQEYVADKSEKYYSNCMAVVNVRDTISGIYGITWYINGRSFEERVSNTASKQMEASFEKKIDYTTVSSADGQYSVYAVIEDNAGNEVMTRTIQFKADDEPPVVNITSDYDKWQAKINLEFDVYDALSGVDYINVTDENGRLITYDAEISENGTHHCSFEITKKGIYYIVAADVTGNTVKETIQVDKVSSEIPECPDITVSSKEADGNNGWYRTVPSVTISNITKTEDDTQAVTKYQLWGEGETVDQVISLSETEGSAAVSIPGEGIYNLKAWSESITGMKCADTHEYQIKVDTVSPDIEYEAQGLGSQILVNFTVTDDGSGVDGNTVKVLHGDKEFSAQIKKTDSGYDGSFMVDEMGDYSIQASDIAGNTARESAFTPMNMKLKAVTNISEHSATIGANIIKGSFDITRAALSYKKAEDKGYIEEDSIIRPSDNNGNIALSAVLSGLSEATVYAYKVTAVSAVGEVREEEGYFRTLPASETEASVNGIARYPDNREGTITVGMFKGNVCYWAMDISAGGEFVFDNVPDGSYSIVATDGTYSKTKRVIVKDGVVTDPETDIELVLSGMNTSVVITTAETPDITADNMDSIFEDDPINFTSEDAELIEVDGTVEFRLEATLMSVSDVSANEIAAMYNATDSNKIVGAYLDLSLYKIVTDRKGKVVRSQVTELANGANISVTIPLGELTGKTGLEVVRIHDTGDSNYLGAILPDRDNNPNTYTVTTNQFSTYAILYTREAGSTTEDKPTTDPDIGKDDPTTDPDIGKDDPVTEKPTPGGDNETPPSLIVNFNSIDASNDKQSPKTVTSKDKTSNNAKSGTNASSVGSLRSSGTAQTGDGTPIAMMGTMMMLSVAGIFILKRKEKQEIKK